MPEVALSSSAQAKQSLGQAISLRQRQGLKLLAMNLPELRQELLREMSVNPVIEDIEPTLEKTVMSECEAAGEEEARNRIEDYPDDYDPSDEFDRASAVDAETLERRQRFFDNQTAEETLERHLLVQAGLCDFDEVEKTVAELVIGNLDEKGYYAGTIADLCQVTGESEARVIGVMNRIAQFDPLGCGLLDAKSCLLAQLGQIRDPAARRRVKKLLERHFTELASGRDAELAASIGASAEEFAEALAAIRTLNPWPGREYNRLGKSVEYVNPEVHVYPSGQGYVATVDARSLPEVKISRKYLTMLEDPAVDRETKAYIRERIAHAHGIVEAVERRQETVQSIAQAIVDAQPGFFKDGLKGLRPLTMQEIADKVGVHHTTVSRTVNDKYASTPKGTVELRRFFVGGIAREDGGTVTRDAVHDRLREIVEGEDASAPLSDERIAAQLKSEGFAVARRTVAKYRGILGIPGAAERKAKR